MEGNSSSSSSSFYKCRLCKVTLLFLGFIWFLLIGVVDSTRTVPPPPPAVSSGFRGQGVINHDGQRSSSHRNKDHHKKMERLKFVSKRRVPNGPDPIHNRRAGNSNQPPGRSQGVVDAEIKGRRL